MNAQTAAATARQVLGVARQRRLSFVAASLAYYTLVSTFPLGVLAVVVATTLGGATTASFVVDGLGAALSPAGATVVEEALLSAAGRGGVTLLGLAILLWGSLRVFRGLDVAFTVVYGGPARESLPAQFRDAVVALGAITVAVVAVAAVVALVALSGVPVAGLLGPIALVGVLVVVFFPVYYVFPDADVTVREVLPGALLAATGWTVLGAAFSVYATVAGSTELFGVMGAVLLLVTWFYAASYVLLLGATLNAVLAGRTAATGGYNRPPDASF